MNNELAEQKIKNNGYLMRWCSVGPYYAMFPHDFAIDVIRRYTEEGDHILDPFAGRGTSLFAAGAANRKGLAIDINPVGWIYGKTKINPASPDSLIERLTDICSSSIRYIKGIYKLPKFFHHCYCEQVLGFLLASRENLNWKENHVDRTLMTFILIYLHGKKGTHLSNQMQIVKAVGPNYAINWWKKYKMSPPELDPLEFFIKKIKWRYEKGAPNYEECDFILGDTVEIIDKINSNIKYKLLLTSPPYYKVTDYFWDQWLRLWMLGGPNKQKIYKERHKNRFLNKDIYKLLLENVFLKCSLKLSADAVIYVRSDAREYSFAITKNILKNIFPEKKMEIHERPLTKKSQTRLFGDNSPKPGDIDIILS